MSSYLAEVLCSVEMVEVEQVYTKCPELSSSVETCKNEVISCLENAYVRFLERPRENKALADKVNRLQGEVTCLMNQVEQLTRKDSPKAGKNDLEKHLSSLRKINIAISSAATLYKIHETLVKIEEFQENEAYIDCMEKVKEAYDHFKNLQGERFPVGEELGFTLITEKSALLNKLSKIFNANVILKTTKNQSVMKIKKNEIIKEVLSALCLHRSTVTPLDIVASFLWNHAFTPAIDSTTQIEITVEGDFAAIEIIIVYPKKKSTYTEVFAQIKTILKFLLDHFNICMNENLSTLDYIGRDIRDKLSELIIKHCLQNTIPSTSEGLQQYKDVIEAAEDLEKSLVMSKILSEDAASIREYVNNVDVLFINKKCLTYQIAAKSLMMKDLQHLVEVGEDPETDLNIMESFPLCAISRNVVDLLNLLEKILKEATNSSEVYARRLFCTARDICLTYGRFVPERHKKLLQTIPQQIALFYNNCAYISYKLSEYNSTYLKKLPSLSDIGHKSLNDEGRQLREIAAENFTCYIDTQIKQIEQIMKSSGLQKQQLDPLSEKCVRKSLAQLELLKTAWDKVLPHVLYNKSQGAILNSLCNHLNDALLKFEDVTPDAAKQLLELVRTVQIRGPELFTDPKEVSSFVPGWSKLNELAFVLGSSLEDINDRKGTLGLQFKAEELRQLVRALFRESEKRAALLAQM